MTDKQKTTLILFAQNHSLRVIAKTQGVCLATIRERIKSLSKNHPREFNNSVELRGAYKRARENIKHQKAFNAKSIDLLDINRKF